MFSFFTFIIISLLFFGLIFLANDILGIPFEIYDHFVIEQRYGFNKVTPKIFVGDKIKGYALYYKDDHTWIRVDDTLDSVIRLEYLYLR